ncbi:hypothetical protein B27N_01545 [Alcanivorax marinus]|nr:hypothetical protein [Alloalcanivorax marinus]
MTCHVAVPLFIVFANLNTHFPKLLIIHRRRGVGHQAGGGLGFREGDHVTDRVAAGHQHHHAVQAEGQTTVGRRAVFQAVQQEAEFLLRFLVADAQGLEHHPLHLRTVDTDRAAAQLGAVEHHIVSPGQRPFRVALQFFRVALGHGERMVQRVVAAVLLLEHGEVHHPQRRPVTLGQAALVADLDAQGADRLVDDPGLVGAEEDQIAVGGAGARQDALDRFLGEELEDRRLQALGAGGQVVDLDVGQTLGAVDADELGVLVDFLAAQVTAAGHVHGHHPAFGVLGRAGEHLELHAVHQVGDVDQFQGHAQVRLVGAVAAHGLFVGHAREFRQVHLEHVLEHAFHHRLGDRHDVVFLHEGGFQVDLGELRLAVGAQVLVTETLGDLVVAVEAGHHQQLLEQLRRLGQREEAAGVGAAGHQIIAGAFRGGAGQDRRFHVHEALAFQMGAHRVGQPRAELEALQRLRTAQIQIAVLEAHFLAGGGVLVQLERRGLGLVEDGHALAQHLDVAGGHARIADRLVAQAHAAFQLQHVLAAHLVGQGERVLGVRIEHHLHQAGAVAHVQEDHPAVVAAAVHPTAQPYRFPVVGGPQITAIMATHFHCPSLYPKRPPRRVVGGWLKRRLV